MRATLRLVVLTLLCTNATALHYFAFGSNMHPAVLEGVRGITPLSQTPGRIDGWRLGFTLRGGPAEPAFASAEPDARRSLWGVAFELSALDGAKILATEGVPLAYVPVPVRVVVPAANTDFIQTDRPSARRAPASETYLTAFTLVSAGPLRGQDRRPSERYLNLLREGARLSGLPRDWISYLDNLEPDPEATGAASKATETWRAENQERMEKLYSTP
ncbi:hypothetical protein M885DRAFT_586829 [Pelagophyceae sp. CCMP2097]|nr:hypothetical protein M885DRAFT_586829 [Pelagophyceae sp. CCMP2097]